MQDIAPTGKRKTFLIEKLIQPYFVTGTPTSNLDLIWLSEKSSCSPGSKVRITDNEGNSKVFIKE